VTVEQLAPDVVRGFLSHLEEQRQLRRCDA
jgi:hypothetical protein